MARCRKKGKKPPRRDEMPCESSISAEARWGRMEKLAAPLFHWVYAAAAATVVVFLIYHHEIDVENEALSHMVTRCVSKGTFIFDNKLYPCGEGIPLVPDIPG